MTVQTKLRWILISAAVLGFLSEVIRGLDRLTHSSLGYWGRLLQPFAPKLGVDFPSLRLGVFDPIACSGFLLLLVLAVRYWRKGGRLGGPTLLILSLIWFSSLIGLIWVPAYMVYFVIDENSFPLDAFITLLSHAFWFVTTHRCLQLEAMVDGTNENLGGDAEIAEGDREIAPKWMRLVHFLLDPMLAIMILGFWAARFVTKGRFWGRYSDGAWEGTEAWIWFPAGFIALLVFYVVFEMAWQKTPGKFLTGSFTTNLSGSQNVINFRVALIRTLIRLFPLDGISFLRTKGGFHDTWTSTRVECSVLAKNNSVVAIGFGGLLVFLAFLVGFGNLTVQPREARIDYQKYRFRMGSDKYFISQYQSEITTAHLIQLDLPEGNPEDADRVVLKVEKIENGIITAARMETSSRSSAEDIAEEYLRNGASFQRIQIDSTKFAQNVIQGEKDPDGPGFDYLGDGERYQIWKLIELDHAGVNQAILIAGGKDSTAIELHSRSDPFRLVAIEDVGKSKRRRVFPKTALYSSFEASEGKRDRAIIRFNMSKNALSEIGSSIVLVLEDATGETRIHLTRIDSTDQLRRRSQEEIDWGL